MAHWQNIMFICGSSWTKKKNAFKQIPKFISGLSMEAGRSIYWANLLSVNDCWLFAKIVLLSHFKYVANKEMSGDMACYIAPFTSLHTVKSEVKSKMYQSDFWFTFWGLHIHLYAKGRLQAFFRHGFASLECSKYLYMKSFTVSSEQPWSQWSLHSQISCSLGVEKVSFPFFLCSPPAPDHCSVIFKLLWGLFFLANVHNGISV